MDRSSLHASLRMRRSAGKIASLAEADSRGGWETGDRGWEEEWKLRSRQSWWQLMGVKIYARRKREETMTVNHKNLYLLPVRKQWSIKFLVCTLDLNMRYNTYSAYCQLIKIIEAFWQKHTYATFILLLNSEFLSIALAVCNWGQQII